MLLAKLADLRERRHRPVDVVGGVGGGDGDAQVALGRGAVVADVGDEEAGVAEARARLAAARSGELELTSEDYESLMAILAELDR